MAPHKFNSGEHIDDIVSRTACAIHDAMQGVPCFNIRYGNGKSEYGPAICGIRIKKAGFNGKIHPSSLSRGRESTSKPKR